METPACLPFSAVAEVRGERGTPEAPVPRLWCVGSLEGLRRPVVAIVGTRAATAYGKNLARRFAAELGAAGCCIVSGLALGIDTAAHVGALEAGAPTVGVIGSGHDRFFPRRNRELAERIVRSAGAVLSPYPPGQPAYRSQFLERNGVVAALSDAVVVVEAPARSGALNTAGWAAGRILVFAVPGDVDRPGAAGCHALIRDGAILARNAADVLRDLRLAVACPERTNEKPARTIEDPVQRRIVRMLGQGELSIEELLLGCQAPPPSVFAALSYLEIAGVIEARPGQRYALR